MRHIGDGDLLMLIVSANPFLGNPRRNDQGYTESVISVKRFTACRIVAKTGRQICDWRRIFAR
ncbi:hypothetical protein M8494_12390 [Serratia ureilytica]